MVYPSQLECAILRFLNEAPLKSRLVTAESYPNRLATHLQIVLRQIRRLVLEEVVTADPSRRAYPKTGAFRCAATAAEWTLISDFMNKVELEPAWSHVSPRSLEPRPLLDVSKTLNTTTAASSTPPAPQGLRESLALDIDGFPMSFQYANSSATVWYAPRPPTSLLGDVSEALQTPSPRDRRTPAMTPVVKQYAPLTDDNCQVDHRTCRVKA
jgi:hypothetical protein